MIPKKAHVVWLGGPMPEREKKFLENNKKVLFDYEVTLWGNNNFLELVNNHPVKNFIVKAIEIKKYAFASDAIKLIALEKYGGWSLDADNEVVKSFNDFLDFSFVTGFEKYKNYSPVTAVWGAVPDHKFTKLLLDEYLRRDFDYLTWKPNTKWITEILLSYGVKNDNSRQRIDNIELDLFPDYVFCGPKTKGTYSLHHFNGSWL